MNRLPFLCSLALRFSLGAVLFVVSKPARAEDKPVSYYSDVFPIFKRSCNGCHHPGKLKGQLDLTTYEALQKGGKHGAAFKAKDAKSSVLFDEISGSEPSMPKEGDALTKQEVAMIERWIAEGATNDTPANAHSFKLAEPPVYTAPPVVTALAYSPDGKVLAVSGYHEVLLHSATGSNLIARLVGESPRIESLAFSPDGQWLAVAGGAPALFGEVQIWDTASHTLRNAYKVSADSIFGIAISPDGDRIAFGCADKSVRILAVKDGKELLKFDNHSDWVFGAIFTVNGKRLLTGSRDRAMKLIDPANGQFIDDINKLLESVQCIARHPKEDLVAYGGDLGTTRIYRIAENQGRTAANTDVNLVREFERLPGAVYSIAYSPDAATVAVGGANGELRLYNTKDGKRAATLKGHQGAVFAVAYSPTTNQIATAGFDGNVRIYETGKGELVRDFIPVPLKPREPLQSAAK